MTIIRDQVRMPAGAIEATDWADVGKPEQFRCFAGPNPNDPRHQVLGWHARHRLHRRHPAP